MSLPDLLRTKIHLAAMTGFVDRVEGGHALHTPEAPTFFHGNCVVLDGPPARADDLRERFERAYGPKTRHALFVWGGAPASAPVLERAQSLGFRLEADSSMFLGEAPGPDERWPVRRLGAEDMDMSAELSRLGDGSASGKGDPSYATFKSQVAEMQASWVASGHATWWGVFDGADLVGQAGFVHCDSQIGRGLGRFQDVVVRPSHRGRGIATSLVTTIARDGFTRYGCPRVILETDPFGPAAALYERIGFRKSGDVFELLWSADKFVVRRAVAADLADVAALARASSGHAPIEGAGLEPALTYIIERNGTLLGYALADSADGLERVDLSTLVVRNGAPRAEIESALDSL